MHDLGQYASEKYSPDQIGCTGGFLYYIINSYYLTTQLQGSIYLLKRNILYRYGNYIYL